MKEKFTQRFCRTIFLLRLRKKAFILKREMNDADFREEVSDKHERGAAA